MRRENYILTDNIQQWTNSDTMKIQQKDKIIQQENTIEKLNNESVQLKEKTQQLKVSQWS